MPSAAVEWTAPPVSVAELPSNVQSITLAEMRNDRAPPTPPVARFARNTQFEIFPFTSPTTAPNLFELFPMNSQSLSPSDPEPCHQTAPA